MKRFDNQTFKKLGFTLGEALITIGIIGVISALTIPALMKSTNDAETVAKVKKAYNTLVNAYDQAAYENDNLPPAHWTGNAFEQMQSRVKHVRTSNCFATGYDQTVTIPAYTFITGDGIAFGGDGTGTIYVDINGPKKPNKSNVDLFTFEFDTDRDTIIPSGLTVEPASFGIGQASACVIFNDNLDYNKNCGTLTWAGNKSCREAKLRDIDINT